MSVHCCGPDDSTNPTNPNFRRVLWFALVVNAAMFVVEIIFSEAADSVSLKADALDFFADAANYAISLFVVAASLSVRAKASIIKAVSMFAFGVFIIATATLNIVLGSEPVPHTMGIIGLLALVANVVVAIALFRFKDGDSNMQSVWLCSRNDAIGNLAVVAAGVAVFMSGTRWPDIAVAMVMASLAISSSLKIVKIARAELAHSNCKVGDPSHHH